MSPFDFIKQINHGKKNLIDETPILEKEYTSFIINRGLSFQSRYGSLANEMNVHNHLDPKLQFDFLLNTLRTRQRWGKWIKRENNDVLELIKNYYNCSYEKARDYSTLLKTHS